MSTAVRAEARRRAVPAARGPRSVLFVERTVGFGGSTVGLGHIVSRLDPERFRARIVVSHERQREYLANVLRANGAPAAEIVVVPSSHKGAPRPVTGPVSRLVASARGVVEGWRQDLPWIQAVHEFAMRGPVDLVHLNNSLSVNRGGIVVAHRLGVPCVVKQRGFEWHSWGVRRLLASVDHFLPDSASVAADLVRLGATRDRIRVNWCAIEPEAYDAPVDVAAVRASLGVPGPEPVVGIVGMLVGWKGQDVFLDAVARVALERPDVRAVVVGSAPDGRDSAWARRLEERAARLGIADRVRFAGHRADVPAVLRALDVVVHASTAPEPFGTIVAEALAAGRPVVAADAGGPAEYVVPGETGLLAAPGDAAGCAAAILRHLREPEAARRMGEAGRRLALRRFAIERHARVTQDVYARVLAVAAR